MTLCLWPTGCGQNQFEPVWLWAFLPLAGSYNGSPGYRTWGFWPNFKANWLLIWITPGCQGLIPFLKINTLKRSRTLTNGYMCVFVHHRHTRTNSKAVINSLTGYCDCSLQLDKHHAVWSMTLVWYSWKAFTFKAVRLFSSMAATTGFLLLPCFNCLPQMHPYYNYSLFC